MTEVINGGKVTPRMRCVDWNRIRNTTWNGPLSVTPRMRCVDWNTNTTLGTIKGSTSHLVWGVWIEIIPPAVTPTTWTLSHLVWGVWIEMDSVWYFDPWTYKSHLVWGVWIEMTRNLSPSSQTSRHTSYEVCGLKSVDPLLQCQRSYQSHLVWGVWIEIN